MNTDNPTIYNKRIRRNHIGEMRTQNLDKQFEKKKVVPWTSDELFHLSQPIDNQPSHDEHVPQMENAGCSVNACKIIEPNYNGQISNELKDLQKKPNR